VQGYCCLRGAVISYAVTQRTHEIGVRVALGAQLRDVLRPIIGQGLMLTLIGIALGATAALVVMRLIPRPLYDVSTTDPLTSTLIPVLLIIVALVACYLPARRATRVEPSPHLRQPQTTAT
jgi:putative ABC transport system permease protein